jgi:hypothetical protein
VITPVADLVDADAEQPLEPALIGVISDDRADRVPVDPQQPRDRRERHLLRQPRNDVFEVARVRRPGPGSRHRLESEAAVAAAQLPQLALDHAAAGAEIEVPR